MKTARIVFHTLLLSMAGLPLYLFLSNNEIDNTGLLASCIFGSIIYTWVSNLRNLVNTITEEV